MRFFWQRNQHEKNEARHSAFGASSFNSSSFSASSMALLMVAPVAPAVATEQASMTVSATVLKHASLRVLAQPSALVVTPQDVARGYVDVSTPAQVAIKSNSSSGYMLDIANDSGFIRQILVRGLDHDVQLNAAGGAVLQRPGSSGVTRATLGLAFRFVLEESAQPGTYAWPVRLSVTPA